MNQTGVSSARLWTRPALAVLAYLAPIVTLAAGGGGGGGGLEWETPLQTFTQSITGPVAYGISVIALVVCGGMLVWGGELNEWARRLIMLIFVISMMAFAVQLMSSLFGAGALVLA